MAQLDCHCFTAHRLGAQPAPVPALFSQDDLYIRIVDEEGRLWLWRLDDRALDELKGHQTGTCD